MALSLRAFWAWLVDPANWTRLAGFGLLVVRRFRDDRGLQTASALTYTSLLSLVPLLVVSLAVLSSFGAISDMREAVKAAVFDVLLPSSQGQVSAYIDQSLDNAQSLTAPGLAAIAVTALMLLSTIEGTFNRIWRVSKPRPLTVRILQFWSVLTLGPLLLGASLSLSSYFFAIADDGVVHGAVQQLGRVVPILLQWIAFTVLFFAIPNAAVRFRHAAIGGFVTAVLFELLKLGFATFIDNADNYRVVYGALAAIPIFLMWLYASWTVVLIGAEVAAAVPEWAEERYSTDLPDPDAAACLSSALRLLQCLWQASGTGARLPSDAIEAKAAARAGAMDRLITAGFVTEAADGTLIAGRDYARTPLLQLWQALDLATPAQDPDPDMLSDLRNAEADRLQRPVSELLLQYAAG